MLQAGADSLPPQVSPETADSILFIGKAVRALRPQGGKGSVMQDQLGAGAPLEALQAQPIFNAALFESTINVIRESVGLCSAFDFLVPTLLNPWSKSGLSGPLSVFVSVS